jgi:hypothetical protein
MPGERVDHLPPNALFEDVEIRRRLRTPLARDAGDNGKLSGGFAGHSDLSTHYRSTNPTNRTLSSIHQHKILPE